MGMANSPVDLNRCVCTLSSLLAGKNPKYDKPRTELLQSFHEFQSMLCDWPKKIESAENSSMNVDCSVHRRPVTTGVLFARAEW